MSPDMQLAREAMGRLGLDPGPGEEGLDELVARGRLAAHQAVAVRTYVATHAHTCACGRAFLRGTLPASGACPACGRAVDDTEPPPAPRRGPLGPGDRVGPLLILERLGAGTSGTVWKVRHEELGRESALKVLPGALRDRTRAERFRREAAALGRLNHPNVVRIHATHELCSDLACELELVEGETLEKKLAREGGLPWREAARLVAALARALEHAHRQGVLHRDLKPANVLVRARDGAPLLTDLGLSLLTDQLSSLTAAGAILGTPHYMAPEGFLGRSSPASDVYGLGAILHATLAGEPPGAEACSLEELAAQAARPPSPLVGIELPAALEALRRRALDPRPAERPDAGELARELERLVGGRSASREARPSSSRVARAAAVALVLVGTTAAWLHLGTATDEESSGSSLVAQLLADERDPERLAGWLERAPVAGDEVERALEVALRIDPDRPGLHLLRVARARRLDRVIDPESLAALAALPPGSSEVEAALEHALRPGSGGELALEAARAVHRAHPRWSAGAWRFGQGCLRSGSPRWRTAALEALAVAGEAGAPALRALRSADGWAAAVASDQPLDAPSRELAQALGGLALQPQERAPALAVVLAPTAPPVRAALLSHGMRIGLAGTVPLRNEVERVFGPRESDLPPALVALLDLARRLDKTPLPPWSGREAALARAGAALSTDDPALAGWALARALELGLAAGRPTGELRKRSDLALSLAPAGVGGEREARDRDLLRGHLLQLRIALESREAGGLEGVERRAALERALAAGQGALELSQKHDATEQVWRDARGIAGLLLMLDRPAEARALGALYPSHGLEAELRRRAGDLHGARSLATHALAEPDAGASHRDALGALALIEETLGRRAEADRWLERLDELERAAGAATGIGLDAGMVRSRIAEARVTGRAP